MSKRNKHYRQGAKRNTRHAAPAAASPPPRTHAVTEIVAAIPAPVVPRSWLHAWLPTAFYVLVGVVIALGMVTLKVGFEHTRWGAAVEQQTYGLLSHVLRRFRPDGPEVVIVDIDELPGGTQQSTTGGLVPTPRADLRAILDTLVQIRPLSIAIDIDFSPTPGGWVDDDDPAFFAHVLKLSKATPITLGVFRSLREPREAWLGLPEFASLAGGMWLPPAGLERTPAWTLAPGVEDKLPSLGAKAAAIGKTDVYEQIDESGWKRRFRERTERTSLLRDGLEVGEVLTNHSAVAQLRREAIRISKPQDLWAHRTTIEGRIVLIGGVNLRAHDVFRVPTEDMPIPGVVVHASSAYTLAAEPIWEFSAEARYAIDLALSALLIGAAVGLQRGRYSSSKGDTGRSERRALLWIILVTMTACALMAYFMRVLWLDFLLVAASLWLHPRVARWLHHGVARLQGRRFEIVTS